MVLLNHSYDKLLFAYGRYQSNSAKLFSLRYSTVHFYSVQSKILLFLKITVYGEGYTYRNRMSVCFRICYLVNFSRLWLCIPSDFASSFFFFLKTISLPLLISINLRLINGKFLLKKLCNLKLIRLLF